MANNCTRTIVIIATDPYFKMIWKYIPNYMLIIITYCVYSAGSKRAFKNPNMQLMVRQHLVHKKDNNQIKRQRH